MDENQINCCIFFFILNGNKVFVGNGNHFPPKILCKKSNILHFILLSPIMNIITLHKSWTQLVFLNL